MKKTKIMIFQKHNSKIPKLNFSIGNNTVEITKEYTYLCLKLEPNGKCKLITIILYNAKCGNDLHCE